MELRDDSDVTSFVLWWNNTNPLDLWWRRKYNVAFGSSAHRDISFIDQMIDYEESRLLNKYAQEDHHELIRSESQQPYKPGQGSWLNKQPKFDASGDSDDVDLENLEWDDNLKRYIAR